ncbi:hypothetical protein JCM8115_000518 [Rhodotorula mucilaginosa]
MAGVFSRNAFAALGDGDDFAPVAKPKAAAAPAPAAPAAAAAAPKANNSQPRNNGPRRDNRNRNQGDREVNAAVPVGEGAKEDRAQNFARRGGRGGRGGRAPGGGNPRGNSGTYLGGARPRRENGGGRPFDRQSQTGRVDSEKAEAAGWGAEDGKKELEAEVLAEADAKAEAPAEGAATPVREAPVVEEEEEDNTQTYEEYLAAKAAKKLNISELPEARPANEGEDLFANAQAVTKKSEQEEEWLFGAPKAASNKQKKQKEAKTFLEIEFTSRPPRRDTRDARESTRGGRPARGRGEGRGRGGASRGSTRGQGRSQGAAAPAVSDASAFPALA